jgi:N-acetylneuraminic acid mutarotase
VLSNSLVGSHVASAAQHAGGALTSPKAWTVAGDLAEARSACHAERLTDGRVLIAGGTGISGKPIASAEVYDPTSRLWSSAGTMTAARSNETVTRLLDGHVLVAGGDTAPFPFGELKSAEVFDPQSGSWRETASMDAYRALHTATLLRDGRVLVCGGLGDDGASLATAEIYDPASESWTAARAMSEGRSIHTATLLADGRVLVVGGTRNDTGPIATAEIYDPATDVWSSTGALPLGLYGHTATMLADGRVIVVGGSTSQSAITDAGELFEPTTGRWSATASMSMPRFLHTATRLGDGRVMVAGGFAGALGGSVAAAAEVYDPTQDRWAATGCMAIARAGHIATSLDDGSILVAGGVGLDAERASTEIYDPHTTDSALAPQVDGVRAVGAGARFRLKIAGSHFDPGATVFIGNDTTAWPRVTVRDQATLLVKGGKALKARIPPHTIVVLHVVNPDGSSVETALFPH